jgi:hypothetical protein
MNSTNTVGYNVNTPQHLLIDAGALYKNYGLDSEALIGATSGGNEYDVAVKTRDVKADGVKGNAKGLKQIIDVEVTLKTNMLEITEDIIKTALFADVDTTSNPDYDIITGRTYIADSDYLDNVALVGKLSGSHKPVIIIVKNALCTDGLKFKTEDDKDNVLPITFTGHIDPNTPEILPYEIRYPKDNLNAFILMGTPIIDNSKVLLTFSDTVATTVPKDGFAVTVNGSADVVTTSVRGINALNTILLTLTTVPTSGQAVTVAYTKPALDASDVKSASNAVLATFSSKVVINN